MTKEDFIGELNGFYIYNAELTYRCDSTDEYDGDPDDVDIDDVDPYEILAYSLEEENFTKEEIEELANAYKNNTNVNEKLMYKFLAFVYYDSNIDRIKTNIKKHEFSNVENYTDEDFEQIVAALKFF